MAKTASAWRRPAAASLGGERAGLTHRLAPPGRCGSGGPAVRTSQADTAVDNIENRRIEKNRKSKIENRKSLGRFGWAVAAEEASGAFIAQPAEQITKVFDAGRLAHDDVDLSGNIALFFHHRSPTRQHDDGGLGRLLANDGGDLAPVDS